MNAFCCYNHAVFYLTTITLLSFFRSEYGAFWKCIQAGGIYVFTQLCKMLILATFFPANDASGQEGMDFVGV